MAQAYLIKWSARRKISALVHTNIHARSGIRTSSINSQEAKTFSTDLTTVSTMYIVYSTDVLLVHKE